MAVSPVLDITGRLGIRTGRLVAPAGLVSIVIGAVLFVFPPHSTLAAIALGLVGVAAFALGTARRAGGRWWALIAGVIVAALLFAALSVAGRGLALRVFGETEVCTVAGREQIETGARYHHYGFVHTLACPRAGTLTIRTDPGDREAVGATVAVLDDPGGLLEPDLATRHFLLIEVLGLLGSVALVAATTELVRRSVRSAS